MQVKLLTLNMNADSHLDAVIHHLRSTEYDIIHLQEVCGIDTRVATFSCHIDCFARLDKALYPIYTGVCAISERFTSSPTSYMANATFYKNTFTNTHQDILPLFQRDTPFPSDKPSFEDISRNALHLKLTKDGQTFSVINVHLAWWKTPIEQPHQRVQNEKLIAYVKQLQQPFILSGDFNIKSDQPTIKDLETFATNVTKQYGITNTLNPETFRVKSLFPPGIAVDYIFTSPGVTATSCSVITENLSDHFGVRAELELS